MAFYEELVDTESAIQFFDEAIRIIERLQDMPQMSGSIHLSHR